MPHAPTTEEISAHEAATATSIQVLPTELLLQVIRADSLGITDILRCARLNSRFHSIVTSTVEIQYRLLLLKSNLVNNDDIPSELLPLSVRFNMLRAHRAAIDRLHPNMRVHVPVRIPHSYAPGSTYELVDGIYARGIRMAGDTILTSAITFVILPSILLHIDEPKTWTVDLGMTIHDFGIEPLMDLLVVVQAEPQALFDGPVFPVHFLTIRDGQEHPDVRVPSVSFTITDDQSFLDSHQYLFIIHICGDFVGILFRPRSFDKPHYLVVWNWRTGDLVCTYTPGVPMSIESFAFLDSRHVVLAASHERMSEFTYDVVRLDPEPFMVYCFHPPLLDAGLNIQPPILRSSPCRIKPSGRLTAKPILPPLPFYCDPSPDCRIFSLALELLFELWLRTLPHRVIGARRYTLFAPASLFLNPQPDPQFTGTIGLTTHIQWKGWAARARWLDCSSDPANTHVCYTYGTRHVRWAARPTGVIVDSVLPLSVSPLSSMGHSPSPVPASPCVQLLTFPPPSRPLPPSEYITLAPDKTCFTPKPIFAEEVTSKLPYTLQTADHTFGLEGCEGVCIDGFERIIGLDVREDIEQTETLTVCVF